MAKGTGKTRCWIGFDLGGTKMMAAVFDSDLHILGWKRRRTRSQEGAKAGLDRIVATIDDALADAERSREDIAGIGIGSPGPLDLDRGVILDTPNLGWSKVPLKATLEKEFKCPAGVLNDVDAGAYGEFVSGAAADARCVVGAFPGTGIGGACIYDGEIVRGETQSAFEIGHIPVLPEGPLCGCGKRGCLESIASRLAIASAAAAAAYRGEAPYLLENGGTDLAAMRSGMLAKSIEAGDASIEVIVRKAAHWTGVALATATNLMAPDIILLGGGLVEAMPNLYIQEVTGALKEHVMASYHGSYKVVAAALGDDAAVTGAAAWVQHEVSGE